MRRAIVAVLVWAAFLTSAASVSAGKPTPLSLVFAPGETNTYRIVEYLSWADPWPPDSCTDPSIVYEGIICNRTVDPIDGRGCVWDDDDHLSVRPLGDYIKPGVEVSLTKCSIFGYPHDYGMEQAAGLGLTMSIDLALTGITTKTITTTGTKMCIAGAGVPSDSPYLQPIPNSDGGVGIPGTITYRVRNDTDATIRFNQGAAVAGGSGLYFSSTYDDRWCPHGWPLAFNGVRETDEFGFGWTWDLP